MAVRRTADADRPVDAEPNTTIEEMVSRRSVLREMENALYSAGKLKSTIVVFVAREMIINQERNVKRGHNESLEQIVDEWAG